MCVSICKRFFFFPPWFPPTFSHRLEKSPANAHSIGRKAKNPIKKLLTAATFFSLPSRTEHTDNRTAVYTYTDDWMVYKGLIYLGIFHFFSNDIEKNPWKIQHESLQLGGFSIQKKASHISDNVHQFSCTLRLTRVQSTWCVWNCTFSPFDRRGQLYNCAAVDRGSRVPTLIGSDGFVIITTGALLQVISTCVRDEPSRVLPSQKKNPIRKESHKSL